MRPGLGVNLMSGLSRASIVSGGRRILIEHAQFDVREGVNQVPDQLFHSLRLRRSEDNNAKWIHLILPGSMIVSPISADRAWSSPKDVDY